MASRNEASLRPAEWRRIRHNLAIARYKKGGHTKHRIQYHSVWIPNIESACCLKSLMYEACRMNHWWISAMSSQDDHVHIVVPVPPYVSVAEAVQVFKGDTSRLLRKKFPELEEFLWGESFWADGHFAETAGKVNEEIVMKDIR